MNLLSISQAVEKHKPKPHPSTIRQAIESGKLKAQLIGKTLVFTEPDYLKWLEGYPHQVGRPSQE